MKQLEVQIMGQSYLLGCPENGDARLLEAVSRVDGKRLDAAGFEPVRALRRLPWQGR